MQRAKWQLPATAKSRAGVRVAPEHCPDQVMVWAVQQGTRVGVPASSLDESTREKGGLDGLLGERVSFMLVNIKRDVPRC